jgi:hypothetical protein
MQAAAREFGVPARLLLAISYSQTRWQSPGAAPSVDGGYGLMDLTTATFPAPGGRGLAGSSPRTVTLARTHDTLTEAARLLNVPAATLKSSDRQNIRGAAAVLARYARTRAAAACQARSVAGTARWPATAAPPPPRRPALMPTACSAL